jgi:hypothetical protein
MHKKEVTEENPLTSAYSSPHEISSHKKSSLSGMYPHRLKIFTHYSINAEKKVKVSNGN